MRLGRRSLVRILGHRPPNQQHRRQFSRVSRVALAIALILGCAGQNPTRAQQGGAGTSVELPPPSSLSGRLVRLPNGQLSTVNGTTITRQIANAPGWQRGHGYVGGDNFTSDRVLAGPGWTAGAPGSFTNGRPVYLWIDTKEGAARSAPSGNGPQSCPHPGSTTAVDGGVTWKCLTRVDYDTITGFLFDDAPWHAGTAYHANEYVISDTPPKIYRITVAKGQTLTAPPYTCTSGSTAPKGTGTDIADGTCAWIYVIDLGYSSQASFIPKQKYLSGFNSAATVQMTDYHVGNIWYGGLSRPEYVPGANGEMNPIAVMAHWDFTHDNDTADVGPGCGIDTCDGGETTWPTSYTGAYRVTLMAQPTDSFAGNPKAQSRALAYDAANGVAIHATSARSIGGWTGLLQRGDAIELWDSQTNIYGLQIKSDNAGGIEGPRDNNETIQNVIIDAVGNCDDPSDCRASEDKYGPLYLDGGGAVLNSLIIMRGTKPGATGIWFKYVTQLINLTIINAGHSPGSACIVQLSAALGRAGPIRNVYCGGFTYQVGYASILGRITLKADVDPRASSISTNGRCCESGISYVLVDHEIMQIIAGAGSSSIAVARGALGTIPAAHTAGSTIGPTFDPTTIGASAGNATSNTPQAPSVTFLNGKSTYLAINLPQVDTTCGGHSCFGVTAEDAFVSATRDFRLSPSSRLRGSGAPAKVRYGWNAPYVNSADIVGTPRPRGGEYDIGAWQAPSDPPSPNSTAKDGR